MYVYITIYKKWLLRVRLYGQAKILSEKEVWKFVPTTKIYGVHDSKKEARVSFFVLELQKALLVPRTCFFLPCTFQLVCAILIWKCASFMVCTLRQNRVRMPRGCTLKNSVCTLRRVHRSQRGCTGLCEGTSFKYYIWFKVLIFARFFTYYVYTLLFY